MCAPPQSNDDNNNLGVYVYRPANLSHIKCETLCGPCVGLACSLASLIFDITW